jgi:hypothetical protein
MKISFTDDNTDSIMYSVLLACPLLKRLVLAANNGLYVKGLRNLSNCKMLDHLDVKYCTEQN